MKAKLPNVSTYNFLVMSKMVVECHAINLSQGFPNFDSCPKLIVLVSKAMEVGHNQYVPMPGHLGLGTIISENIKKALTKYMIPPPRLKLPREQPK